jgi:O-acetyl-ADP-ribose deacetylase (regulator of RNase III)
MSIPIEIDVWQGEIAQLEVDAILIPANESLFMTTPVGRAVKQRSGESVEADAVSQGPVAAGSAVVTGGGRLAAPYVIHVVGVGHDLVASEERLDRAIKAALDQSARLGLRRLATAPIGMERGVFDAERAAAALARALVDRAEHGSALPAGLVVAVGSPGEAAAYRAALQSLGAVR